MTFRMWTIGRKVAAGFGLAFLVMLVLGAMTFLSTWKLVEASLQARRAQAFLTDLHKAMHGMEASLGDLRGFHLTGKETFLAGMEEDQRRARKAIGHLAELKAKDPDAGRKIEALKAKAAEMIAVEAQAVQIRRDGGVAAAGEFVASGLPNRTMASLREAAEDLEVAAGKRLEEATGNAQATASGTRTGIIATTLAGLAIVLLATILITRSLDRQIGSAIRDLRASVAELQAAANQQAAGTTEQAAALGEVATTLKELLATSRQIAESSQHVTRVADETASAARAGDLTLQRAQDANSSVRRQVDLIVNHMLDLGKKSQEIGGILDVIGELAEQTNILAINATIESAGAGEAGRRFNAVAEEIRKLADRVGNSTRDIRALIEEMRAAANTTVMTTEDGSKAVDAGNRQFAEVASAFRQIAASVDTTGEVAREIELSTKQQATAVEQVNLAIASSAQAAKETEASARQTLQTSTQLAALSRDLTRMIRAQSAN